VSSHALPLFKFLLSWGFGNLVVHTKLELCSTGKRTTCLNEASSAFQQKRPSMNQRGSYTCELGMRRRRIALKFTVGGWLKESACQ
jgi:hypothetical protein